MSGKLSVRDYKRDKKIIKYYEKMKWTHKQIAEALGISKARVGQLYDRVVKERQAKSSKQLGIGG